MKKENKHNGWTNYATWRCHLEIFDGYNPIDDEDKRSAYEIGESLKDMVFYEILKENPELALSYAREFLADVNWHEIAKAKIDEYSND